ncbi:MAG: carbohydrate-binding domain-containing protein [Flexilinea sp.]|nr:carbohydrate-binding domain-containing protein [Flexilinea sp.]
MKKSLLMILVVALFCMQCAPAAFAVSAVPEISGGQLKITEAGTYRFVGSMKGTILVDPGEGDVVLVMDNFRVDGDRSAGIIALSGDSLTIRMEDQSYSRITDGGTDPEFKAAIYSRVNTVFEGNGAMDITGFNQEAIHVENADLTFNGGTVNMMAPDRAIAVDGNRPGMLYFDDGAFNIFGGTGSFSPETNVIFNGGSIIENNSDAVMHFDTDFNHLPETIVTNVDFQPEMMIQPGQANNISAQQYTPVQPASNQSNSQPSIQPAFDQQNHNQPDSMPGQQEQNNGMQIPGQTSAYESASSASEIVSGTTYNSAMDLTADYDNATTYDVSETSQVKISESGTYIVTGTSSDGNITVKKDTTGVVLVLDNLDLTSTTGAAVSINKNAEVQVIISGNVVLTDNENPADENSTDADIADAFDGAAFKAKAGSMVYMTGDGTLTINGNAKNGIKGGDDSSIIIDGVTMNIKAVNDGINSNYDVTLLSGDFTIDAADDAIHADHILTIGDETTHRGPSINVTNSNEGLEGTVVNIHGGDITINSTDDAINAANGDGVYEGELDYSFNMTGGKVTIKSGGDGIDSNGNVNLIGGNAQISSASMGGEAGIDYDGQIYISDDFGLNNNSGVAGPDNMPGGMNGQGFGPAAGNEQNGSFTPNGAPESGSNNFGWDNGPSSMGINSGWGEAPTSNTGFGQSGAPDFGGGPGSNGFSDGSNGGPGGRR